MYCMYLRKSRKDIESELGGEEETLKRHENILLDLATKMNISINKDAIYREVVSGETIASRPEMQRLLSDVEQGVWKGVFVIEVERLARGDTMDQGLVAQTFKYSNTKIISPMKIYDPLNEFDEEYFEFGLFMSRREYKAINRRLQRGRIQSIQEGKYLGTMAPYGYKRVKLKNQKGYTLEINPNEAKIVKLIYKLYTDDNRIGISLIANKLNEIKIPTVKGGDWTTSTIRGILSNPVYIGKIRWNSRPEVKKMIEGKIIKERPRADKKDWILVKGLHNPIIDEYIFNLAQKYLEKNPTVPVPTRYKIMNPLAGLIVCKICNRKLKRRPYKNYPATLICDGPTCTNVSSYLNLVEKRLLDSLEIWLQEHKLKYKKQENKKYNLEIDIINKSISKLDIKLDTLNKQLNNMYDLLEQGIYSNQLFINRSKLICEEIDSLKKDKNYLLNKINSEEYSELHKEILIPKIENIIKVYWTLDEPADKNNLLKEILEKAVYCKTVNGRWHNNPDEFELEIYLKLPR
ncbi:Site-specific DNA recombinase [Tissierella praeacuta DSM 18095]|uniref:Site-specific DNA recombinase n=2 Tax=Tissierella praeacuta TaxID=43131 RepID=A0A1M4YD36_9FIRM|nr:recombinase family protein [Tissierella praeacuta]TCU74195.1 DNA invertase Pin-like site-specific DNA recombinase [Tissierella praeacuta]SHF03751.1 Site-specific DNA recombinase [Tissierella praeacuta DSM 18095]SUP03162.1 Recombinase [Tissierella praeacuta]